jgi:C4-dicarboxylate transporter DctQ subunit
MCFRFLQALMNFIQTGHLPHHEPAADLIAETERGVSESEGARA